eukprot:976211-Alexandrium_andersonii.AAC.1
MSASLVGSEMCIRDRPQNLPPKLPRAVFRADAESVNETCGRACDRRFSCLLYTSDAADDM